MTDFNKISPDQDASYKQVWAVAYKFAEDFKDKFPSKSIKALAVIFRAVILKYHAEKGSFLTHGEVQGFLSGKKKCPAAFIEMIDLEPRSKSTNSSINRPKKMMQDKSNISNSITNIMKNDLDKLHEDR